MAGPTPAGGLRTPPDRSAVIPKAVPRPAPSGVAVRLRDALTACDCRRLEGVLHQSVHWSQPDGGDTGCSTRSHVLSRLSRLHALGLRARVEETFSYPAAVVLGLRILGMVPPAAPERVAYHVFDITDGLIVRVTGYADRAEALEAALSGVRGLPAYAPVGGQAFRPR